MNESKVNQKSQKLVIKKIEKDILNVLDFVDDEGAGLITYNGLGYILFFLDVFKVQYNDEYMAKLMQINSKHNKDTNSEQSLNHIRPISFVTAKNEERRKEEEKFHHKLWKLLNPYESDYIEREILNEFLKLMFDPYTAMKSLVPIIKELIDIIHNAKSMKAANEELDNNELMKDRAPTMKAVQKWIDNPNKNPETVKNQKYTMDQFETPIPENKQNEDSKNDEFLSENIEEILNTFKDLYNYQGGNRKIKIPSYKKQKAFYEVYKEWTFKPALNKKSLEMKQHKKKVELPILKDGAGKIVKTHQNEKLKSAYSKSPIRNNLAGKIVSRSKAQEIATENTNAEIQK